MSFASPLWLLLIPMLLLVAAWESLGRRGRERTRAWPAIRRLWAGPGGLAPLRGELVRRFRPLLWGGLILASLSLARPQWGIIEYRAFHQSREVLLALDLSRSMLAEDVRPSRLERSKLLIQTLLDRLAGERVGLLLFAGTAFLQSPLSSDYQVLREFLPILDPDYLPVGGTDYDRLLQAALESFSDDAGSDRFLIILSDGESQTETWRRWLDGLQQKEIRVIGLGVGTETGGVIPFGKDGLLKDEQGAVVLSKMNPQTLQELAEGTGGLYRDASSWIDLAALIHETVEAGQAGTFSERRQAIRAERYQIFLAAALLFLALSFWREFPARPDLKAGAHPARKRASRAAAGRAALWLLAAALPVIALRAAVPPAIPSELPKVVARLSAQERLAAPELAGLAEVTIEHAETVRAGGMAFPPGIVHDGLAAVDLGERLDPQAADWPRLREELERLLDPPEPPPEDQDQQEDGPSDESQDNENAEGDSGGSPSGEPPEGEGDDQESSENGQSDPGQPEGDEDRDPGERPAAFGEMRSDPAERENNPQPEPAQTRQVDSLSAQSDSEVEDNPELALPLQKLDQVKNQDSPAKLFQMMEERPPEPPSEPRRDW